MVQDAVPNRTKFAWYPCQAPPRCRGKSRLTRSFGMKPSYLTDEFDRSDERYLCYMHGFEQSHRFRGLKILLDGGRRGRL
jgi:hypothetical protein